jgi:hypothetical protein
MFRVFRLLSIGHSLVDHQRRFGGSFWLHRQGRTVSSGVAGPTGGEGFDPVASVNVAP